MDLDTITVLVKGGGDVGTGVAHRLFCSGIKTAVADLSNPSCIRRFVSFSTAITDNSITVEGVAARLVREPFSFDGKYVPVFTIDRKDIMDSLKPAVIVDAVFKNIQKQHTIKGEAPFTVGLGPGFRAPDNIDCVIETKEGHNLGKVIWSGETEKYTDAPANIDGYTSQRVLRSPDTGRFKPLKKIGDMVEKNELIGWVNRKEIRAGVHGIIRGLVAEDIHLAENEKMGDVDPRSIKEYVFTISDRSRAIGGGVLEAVLAWAAGH
ncbi:MAG: EF2563 family selenium-dependent molybdenum hydroxylase system protein [Elusimicrobia bacterium]|nr:EF2563 family selenium-dependent molybdenum hydroxylase system protein [Elusimicrobiota bacterium]